MPLLVRFWAAIFLSNRRECNCCLPRDTLLLIIAPPHIPPSSGIAQTQRAQNFHWSFENRGIFTHKRTSPDWWQQISFLAIKSLILSGFPNFLLSHVPWVEPLMLCVWSSTRLGPLSSEFTKNLVSHAAAAFYWARASSSSLHFFAIFAVSQISAEGQGGCRCTIC